MKRIITLLSGCLLYLYSLAQTPATDRDFNFQSIYRIKNVKTQKAMEVEDGAFEKGTKVQQYFSYSRNGFVDGHNQEWLIIPAGRKEGLFVFYIINNGFLKYLDAILPLGVNEGLDSETQLWVFEKTGQNWLIRSFSSRQYLQIPEGSVKDGDRFNLSAFTGQLNQQFVLISTGATVPTSITHGALVNITPSYADSKAMDASGASERDGEPIKINELRNGETKQQWQITLSPGYYEMKPKNASAKCAEVLNFSTNDSDPAGCWTCVNGLNQKWIIVPVARESGRYIFFNRNSGKCLTVQGGNSTQNGTKIVQFTYANRDNSKWKITPAR
jgi:hypothetical protein